MPLVVLRLRTPTRRRPLSRKRTHRRLTLVCRIVCGVLPDAKSQMYRIVLRGNLILKEIKNKRKKERKKEREERIEKRVSRVESMANRVHNYLFP